MEYKRCTNENHEGKRYLPISEFYKQGKYKGKQQYSGQCKVCQRRDKGHQWKVREDSRKDDRKAYSRARSRALTRLAYTTPKIYLMLLKEELLKEGMEHKKLDQFLHNVKAYHEQDAV